MPLTGSPPVPQLMRLVLHESLKALKTRGWDERSVSQSGLRQPVPLGPVWVSPLLVCQLYVEG